MPRSALSKKGKQVVPKLSENQEIQLLHVCHPLVKNAVANDVHFGKDLTAIVITGPNTGGKTIMLKTLGLTQVMAQSGLPILADKGSRVGIFEEFLLILAMSNLLNRACLPSLAT